MQFQSDQFSEILSLGRLLVDFFRELVGKSRSEDEARARSARLPFLSKLNPDAVSTELKKAIPDEQELIQMIDDVMAEQPKMTQAVASRLVLPEIFKKLLAKHGEEATPEFLATPEVQSWLGIAEPVLHKIQRTARKSLHQNRQSDLFMACREYYRTRLDVIRNNSLALTPKQLENDPNLVKHVLAAMKLNDLPTVIIPSLQSRGYIAEHLKNVFVAAQAQGNNLNAESWADICDRHGGSLRPQPRGRSVSLSPTRGGLPSTPLAGVSPIAALRPSPAAPPLALSPSPTVRLS